MKLRAWMRPYCAFVLPVAILLLLALGLWEKFAPQG